MTTLTDLRDVVDVVIGVDTHVHTHSAAVVSNILAKLGVENRGAAAALARNLMPPDHHDSSVLDPSA